MNYFYAAVIRLRQACQIAAPTHDIARAFDELTDDLLAAHASTEEMLTALAGALLDGLQHGNWPQPKET